VGTGSGAIAIAIASAAPGATVWATDTSASSAALAQRNVLLHGLGDRVIVRQGDLLEPVPGIVDLVVANLPYVPAASWPTLPRDVRDFEPRLALDGGPDGTRLVEPLIRQAAKLGVESLLAEIDPRHAETLRQIAGRAYSDRSVEILPDLAGRARLLRIGPAR
jgi:release factor glutamine methyltransferase